MAAPANAAAVASASAPMSSVNIVASQEEFHRRPAAAQGELLELCRVIPMELGLSIENTRFFMPKKSAVEREQQKPLVRRFWRTARGFWSSERSWKVAWLMTACLILLVLAQLFFQYQLNLWNKEIFDALEKKDSATVLYQAMIFVPLAVGSIAVAVCIVYARMRTQRRWRAWLTEHTITRWLAKGGEYQLNLIERRHKKT